MRGSSWLVGVVWGVATASTMAGCLFEDEGPEFAYFMYQPSVEMTAECGKAQTFFPLGIYNYSDETVTIAGARVTGDFAVVDPFPVVFRGNETGALSVRAPLAVVGTDPPLNTKTGKAVLETSEGDLLVELLAQTIGSNLEITDTAGRPLSLAFSGSQCPAPITAKVENRGNVGIVVNAPTPSAFRVEGFVSGMLQPGESRTFTVRPYTTSACTGTEAITFTAAGSLCAAPPVIQASFTMTGSATCSCP